REALKLAPADQNGRRLSVDIRDALRDRMVRSRIEVLWRQANEEAAARRFTDAVDTLRAALQLDEDNLEARERLEHMTAQMEQCQKAAQLIIEAQGRLNEHALSEAHSKVLDALERDVQNPEANSLLAVIVQAIERREKAAKIDRELERAKSLVLVQALDPALAILIELRAENPGSPRIEKWITHVEAQEKEIKRRARIQEVAAQARVLLAEERFVEAVRLLEGAAPEFSNTPAL